MFHNFLQYSMIKAINTNNIVTAPAVSITFTLMSQNLVSNDAVYRDASHEYRL